MQTGRLYSRKGRNGGLRFFLVKDERHSSGKRGAACVAGRGTEWLFQPSEAADRSVSGEKPKGGGQSEGVIG